MRGVVGAVCLLASIVALQSACFSDRPGPLEVDDCSNIQPSADGAFDAVVVIRDFAFNRPQLRVARGATVRWINCDESTHTSRSDQGAWASQLLSRGEVFSRTFPTAGTFGYFCEPHPSMRGQIVVD